MASAQLDRFTTLVAAIGLPLLLLSCASNDTLHGVTVVIDPGAVIPRAQTAGRAEIEISDLRERPTQERTTIGNISMGEIIVQPPEAVLARYIVETKAHQVLAEQPADGPRPRIQVGIREFQITTPATALYWDVTTRVELVLRIGGRDRTASGVATERTYTWPGKEVIERVTTQALQQAARETETGLRELLRADQATRKAQ